MLTDLKLSITGLLFFIFFSTCLSADNQKVRLQLKWEHQFQFAGYYAAVEKGWVQLDERTRPRPEIHAKYEKRFKLYCDLYPSLKHVMHGLQESAA